MLNSKNPTIAIIDSGVGGVSVLRQLVKKYNAGNYIYYADNLFMPYGDKTQEWLKNRLDFVINCLKDTYSVDIIIVACNTASCNIEMDKYSNVITLTFDSTQIYFATELTKRTLSNYNVIADKYLAQEIEKNIGNNLKIIEIIKQSVEEHHLDELKSFVLGCTHYELFKPIFEQFCDRSVIINNSSYLIDNLRLLVPEKELNIVVLLSKESLALKSVILELING
jgi:glutamate racemase